jgi:hypothetical protein
MRSTPASHFRRVPASPCHFFKLVLLAGAVLAIALAANPSRATPDSSREPSRDTGLAQLYFGIKGGLGLAQHQGVEERHSDYEVSSSWRQGITAGIFLYFPVTSRFGLQQEVMYVQKGSRQDISVEILDIPTVLDVTYDMDYVEIPVLLRFTLVKAKTFDLYSLAGFAFALKVHDRYQLSGEVDDGEQVVPISADADMSEVDIFDFSFVYGLGLEFPAQGQRLLVEYRFTLGLDRLPLPTYAYVPFGDEQILIDNEPVPLRNQHHAILVGIRF